MISPKQQEILLRGINQKRIAKRQQAGRNLSYLEAWDVKAHLIRIFGFGGWSSEVLEAELAFESEKDNKWNVGYKVILALTIHGVDDEDGCWATYTEAAIGSATLPQRGEAHDMAIKTAESDALKRAAINLGDQFGLSLYNNGSTEPVVIETLASKTKEDSNE
jgi:recombination DNA repair RAD52 pathway protein